MPSAIIQKSQWEGHWPFPSADKVKVRIKEKYFFILTVNEIEYGLNGLALSRGYIDPFGSVIPDGSGGSLKEFIEVAKKLR